MDILIIAFFVFLVLTAMVGYVLWLVTSWLVKMLRGTESTKTFEVCVDCGSVLPAGAVNCSRCGWEKPSAIRIELLKDIAATERQLERFNLSGKLDDETYRELISKLRTERDRLSGKRQEEQPSPQPTPASAARPAAESAAFTSEVDTPPPVVTGSFIATEDEIVIEPIPSFLGSDSTEQDGRQAPVNQNDITRPKRSFSEVLNSFMEESNIRWGEIVGGLLIIGCSTALVVSLWSEISQIPVVKFLIFTTVTAALFGVGLYTEHRWKLPTTSRGILTIATLLVPLNFLAIAAVSGGMQNGGLAIIASELVAPAIFLCLVYFAGRVLTPSWPHLLVAGVLGSSVGQLLIRHFAAPEIPPILLIALGAFPLVCYVAASIWMLRATLIGTDELDSTPIFITVGALTFAAVLPFSLLLYKTGPVAMSMMYLAPLVSVGGSPALAVGLVLWRHFTAREAVITRTVGTALALLGTGLVVSGMVLAWPNPASIVPAALFSFAVFTALAVVLEFPLAHLLAGLCFAQAYLVTFHVLQRNVSWINLRETSLLDASISINSGLALAPLFIAFLVIAELVSRYRNAQEGLAYLVAANLVAFVSLLLTTLLGSSFWSGPSALWFAYVTCAVGMFWIGWRYRRVAFTWIGSALLLLALAQAFALIRLQFPWQTAIFTHATLCAMAAVLLRKRDELMAAVLRDSAVISSTLAVIALVQAANWESTLLQAQRVLWLAVIWFLLLWLIRKTQLFLLFQVALTFALVLWIKATLQQFVWYAYLPHAFLHPWGLQIQGTSLVLLSLLWVGVRYLSTDARYGRSFSDDAKRLLNVRWSVDRIVLWSVLVGFVGLALYGALPGITRELTAASEIDRSWDIAGFPHEQALGAGSWILLGLLVVTFVISSWKMGQAAELIAALLALSCVCPLVAGAFESDTSTASAWRWSAVIYLLILSMPMWWRHRLIKALGGPTKPRAETTDSSLLWNETRTWLIALTVIPLLVLTIYPTVRAIYYLPVHGPSGGFFSQIDPRLSYALPVVVLAAVLIGHGLRERLPDYVFFSGLLLNAAVTIVQLFSVVAANGSMNRVVVAQTMQLNVIVFALYALVWLSSASYWLNHLSGDRQRLAQLFLYVQLLLAVGTTVLLVVPTSIRLATRPEFVSIGAATVGSAVGWLAFILTLAAAVVFARVSGGRISGLHITLILLVVSCLMACGFASASEQNWTPSHVYLVAITASAFLLMFTRDVARRFDNVPWKFSSGWQREVTSFAAIIATFAGFLALRRWGDDPSSDWWSISPLVAVSIVFGSLNCLTLKRRHIYIGGLAFIAAAFIWAAEYTSQLSVFIGVHVVALTLSSVVWLALELRTRRLTNTTRRFAFHDLAATWALVVVSTVVLVRLVPGGPSTPPLFEWLALLSLLVLLSARLWDANARLAIAAIYIAGLLGVAELLNQLTLEPHPLLWAIIFALTSYSLVSSSIWRSRGTVQNYASQLKIPKRTEPGANEGGWLVLFSIVLLGSVLFTSFWIVLFYGEFSLRFTAAVFVAIHLLTFGLLAEGKQGRRLRDVGIAALVVGLVFAGWAGLTPAINGTWFNRAVVMMVELFALVTLYGLTVSRLRLKNPVWTQSAQDLVPWIIAGGVVALLFALSTEVFYQIEFGAVNITSLAVIAIGATLVAGISISLLFALSPTRDPLQLSEGGRMGYVYAAEAMLALLFMHIRLSMPWLFTGFFERYWPLVVMAVAYTGVAMSESLRRKGLLVLAQPLERTGVFLPLLPVLGFWLARSEVDFSILLFVVGGLYGLLSLLRRSFGFGLLAALAGNAALWYWWHRSEDFQFLQHPQLWLIPVAVSALIAVYLNEKDFTEQQMASIRYLCLVTIYASSTADIFINGVAESPWLPLVLAALSLAGVFGGIVFRIRGFLLLGSVFLLLSIVTMIWYASANLGWTWLWYVAGIVTGATIIFMFAVFEKKRSEVLRVVEGFKEWER